MFLYQIGFSVGTRWAALDEQLGLCGQHVVGVDSARHQDRRASATERSIAVGILIGVGDEIINPG